MADGSDEELQKVKSEIRSILIVRKVPITVSTLISDFSNLVGDLPFKKFGYKTPLQFLCDLKDTVKVIDSASGVKFQAVPNENTQHISDLIAGQKKVNRRPPRRSYNSYRYHSPARYNSVTPGRLGVESGRSKSAGDVHLQETRPGGLMGEPVVEPGFDSPRSEEPAPETTVEVPEPPESVKKRDPKPPDLVRDKDPSPLDKTVEVSRPSSTKTDSFSIPNGSQAAPRPTQPVAANVSQAAPRPTQPEAANVSQSAPGPTQPVEANDSKAAPCQLVWPTPPMIQGFPLPAFANYPTFVISSQASPCPTQPLVQNVSQGPPGQPVWPTVPVFLEMQPPAFANYPPCARPPRPPGPYFVHGQPYNPYRSHVSPRNHRSHRPEFADNHPNVSYMGGSPFWQHPYWQNPPRYYPTQDPHHWQHSFPVSHNDPGRSESVRKPLSDCRPVPSEVPEVAEKRQEEDQDENTATMKQDVNGPTSRPAGMSDDDSERFSFAQSPHELRPDDLIDTSKLILKPKQTVAESQNNDSLSTQTQPADGGKQQIESSENGASPAKAPIAEPNTDLRDSSVRRDDQVEQSTAKRLKKSGYNGGWIPNQVNDNLSTLASRYLNGIKSSELLSLYKENFRTDIKLEELGFKSLEDFLQDCSGIRVEGSGSSCVIYPTNCPPKLPDPSAMKPACPPLDKIRDIWSEHFKEHECDPAFHFLPPIIPEEKTVKLKIVDVYSPELFWVHLVRDMKQFAEFMYQMNVHYGKEDTRYQIPEDYAGPLDGLSVAAPFHGQWHRARILSIDFSGRIEVCFVDYGTKGHVNREDLRKLDKKFSKDPIYAVRSSLCSIRIPRGEDVWSMASYTYLFENYSDVLMYGDIWKVDFTDPNDPSMALVMYYYDEDGIEISLNENLVREKLADAALNLPSPSEISPGGYQVLSNFLPPWFEASTTSRTDVGTAFRNLEFCLGEEREPLNIAEVPCCARHLVLAFFRANPVKMSLLWKSAMLIVEEQMMANVLDALGQQIDDMGWASALEKLSCFKDNQQEPSEEPHTENGRPELVSTVITSPADVLLSLDAQPSERVSGSNNETVLNSTNPGPASKGCSGLVPQFRFSQSILIDPQQTDLAQSNQISPSVPAKSVSARGASPSKPGPDNTCDFMSRCSSRMSHTTRERRTSFVWSSIERSNVAIKYSKIRIGKTVLQLILYESEFWIHLYQLFQLAYHLPIALVEHRFRGANLNEGILQVSSSSHPDLHAALTLLDLPENQPLQLVRLSYAAQVLEVVDPIQTDFGQVFDRLQAKLKEQFL